MSRASKIGLIAAGSLVGLIVVVVLAGIIAVQTEWFRNFVQEKIITSVDESTGGKTGVGSFAFDLHHLRAQLRDLVIHGTEPATAAPLFRARLIQVDLQLTSPAKGFVRIAYLLLDTPQANVMVFPDGRTNMPVPKPQPKTSNKSGLQTLVDLAIKRFDLRNGTATFADRKSNFNASGENLRAQLGYNPAHPSYAGEIDISPLHLRSDPNPPLNVDVRLPLTLEPDRIAVADARLSTNESLVQLSASVDHLAAPQTTGHVNARLALDEVKRAAGLTMPLDIIRGPAQLLADITVSADANRIAVRNASLKLGQTEFTASGPLKDVGRPAALQFSSTLALGELGRLFCVTAQPEGTVRIGGNASLPSPGNYRVQANIIGRNLAAGQGSARITGATLDSSLAADHQRIEVGGLRITALGGDLTGSGALENMQAFHFAGKLNRFAIQKISRLFKPGGLGYGGIINADLQAQGNIKNTSDLVARAAVRIEPSPGGIPVSGRLNIDYQGGADTINIARSYLALPNTRLDLAGSLGQQIQIRLVTRNTADFRPVAAVPVSFMNGGNASLNVTVTGKINAPRIGVQIALANFSVQGRPFTRFDAGLTALPSGATITNAVLVHGMMQARFTASAGLHDWKPENSDSLRGDATIRDADLADVLALSGTSSVQASGAFAADAHIDGTIGDPRGSADLSITNGMLEGDHFDSLTTRVAMNPGSIEIPTLQWLAGPSRLDANATYQHAPNDLKRGTLRAHVATNHVQLAQFQSLVKDRPGLAGLLTLNADAAASLRPAPAGTNFQVTNITANLSARGLQMQGMNLGDFTASANTNGSAVQYNVSSNFAGSTIRVNGQSLLSGDHQTEATAQIANLPIDRVLAVAGRRDLPVCGTFAVNAQVSGTLAEPRAGASLTISNGSAYQQSFNRLQASITYSNELIDVAQFRLEDGGNNVELSGSFEHPPSDLRQGRIQFRVRSNQLQLARFHAVQQAKPGLAGTLELSADGAGTLRPNAMPLFSTLNANLSAKELTLDHRPVGDATFTAATRGRDIAFHIASNLSGADIHGDGTLGLTGDFPLDARLAFANVRYSGLGAWIGAPPRPDFDASVAGQVSVSGPASRIDALNGSLQLTTLEAHSVNVATTGTKPRVQFALRNNGPIDIELNRSVVTIRSARITGPYTTLALSGSAPIRGSQPMNLRADGNIRLELLEAFSPTIFSAGAVTLAAAVTGTPAKPSVTGRLQLQDASFNMTSLPNGLTGANGTIAFNGSEAVIQNITAETGGGKLTLSGTVGYGGPEMQFRVQARADHVSVQYPESITTQASAQIALTGTTSRSLLSGTVRISQVAMHSHTDIGAILNSAGAPPTQQSISSGFLPGMKFDVRIMTTTGVQFRTSLTENLQADANLTLRGNPDHPGMLGRVVINSGQVVFFGNKYSVDQGTISFFDPNQIQPVLNIDLSTTVQGVDVTLSVSGLTDKMKLSYRSDPPLEFKDIVSLLASGTPPTTDPVLAARQAPPPQQSFGQAGASLLLGQAVASPVSGRLQRLFGVSKLKIDPQVTGASNTPAATLTLQQQINNSITFTYIQDVTQSNPQIIRVDWALDPQWSAIVGRDINGEVNIDLFYKKRFH
jgi:translocation and assembly module TamB